MGNMDSKKRKSSSSPRITRSTIRAETSAVPTEVSTSNSETAAVPTEVSTLNTETTVVPIEVCNLLSALPIDILERVLSFVPAEDLLKHCCVVNKQWQSLTDSQKLWREKCERIGIYTKNFPFPPKDFKQYYFKRPFSRNLIRNCDGRDGMKHWSDVVNGGNGFRVEESPHYGCHIITDYAREDKDLHGLKPPISNWATSFGWCSKCQVIDLVEEGCDELYLQEVPIMVEISDWYAPRNDCNMIYRLEVSFMDNNKKVIDKYKFEDRQIAGNKWFKAFYSEDLQPGTRFIKFEHFGKDEWFWAGHYGAKITLSCVKLLLKNNTSS